MHEDTMVTTYTIMSTSTPQGGTWSLSSTVRETLASSMGHVDAMEHGRAHLTVAGGTVSRGTIRYAWDGDPQSAPGHHCHDMVIIVPDRA